MVDALVELMNSRYEPMNIDVLTGPVAGGWLLEHGAAAGTASGPALERLRQIREALRQLALANNGVPADECVLAAGQAALFGIPFLVRLGSAQDPPTLVLPAPHEPASGGPVGDGGSDGAEQVTARIVGEFLVRRSGPRWRELKACPAPGCGYAFLDGSRNGSRRWCLMATCGNRAKNKAWRARHGTVTADPS